MNINETIKGVKISIQAIIKSLKQTELLFFLARMLVGLILANMFVFWLRATTLRLFWWIASYITILQGLETHSYSSLLLHTTFLVSTTSSFLVRLFYSDVLFFKYLALENPKIYDVLHRIPGPTVWSSVKAFAFRIGKYLRSLLFILVLIIADKLLPWGIGGAIGVFYSTRKWFSRPASIVCAFTVLAHPLVREYFILGIHVLRASRVMTMELVNPWICRTEAKMTIDRGLSVGAGLAISLLSYVPLLGPVGLVFGQVVGAEVVIALF